jgi:hypothetical protein
VGRTGGESGGCKIVERRWEGGEVFRKEIFGLDRNVCEWREEDEGS